MAPDKQEANARRTAESITAHEFGLLRERRISGAIRGHRPVGRPEPEDLVECVAMSDPERLWLFRSRANLTAKSFVGDHCHVTHLRWEYGDTWGAGANKLLGELCDEDAASRLPLSYTNIG